MLMYGALGVLAVCSSFCNKPMTLVRTYNPNSKIQKQFLLKFLAPLHDHVKKKKKARVSTDTG